MNAPTVTRVEGIPLPKLEELIDMALMLASKVEEPDQFKDILGFNVAASASSVADLTIAVILKPLEGQPPESNVILIVFVRTPQPFSKSIVTARLYEINNVNLVELKSILLKSNMFTVAPQTIH